MSYDTWVELPERGVVALEGGEARSFLQGLITNDIDLISPSRSIYGALLTPQGGFLHDFLIAELDGVLLLDCDAGQIPDLVRRLGMYRLRADVRIDDRSDHWQVLALWPASGSPGAARPWLGGIVFTDPRHAALGDRAIVPTDLSAHDPPGQQRASAEQYAARRIRLGIPDCATDLVATRERPLEAGFDRLNGVSFDKGCYVGQEVTARMKHRHLVRRRLVAVDFEGPPPPHGTPIMSDRVEVGEIRSGIRGRAMAMLRRDRMEDGRLTANGLPIAPRSPVWMTDGAEPES